MEDWLTNKVSRHRIVMNSCSVGYWSDGVLAKTALRALDNGYLDLECWVYVNKVKQYSVQRMGRDGKLQWERIVAAYETPTNWVLDMDDVPGITGVSAEERIESLFRRLKDLDAFLPRTIIESSPGSFHLVYLGSKDGREWTWERRLATAVRSAGVSGKPRTEKELEVALKAGGVDLSYLKQPLALAKFRLPGSVNVKKSVGVMDTSKIASNVVAVGWNNPDYKLPGIEDLSGMDLLVPIKPVMKSDKRPLPDAAWKRFMPELRTELAGLVRSEIVEPLSEFFAKNFNFLQKKKCRILQTYMAEKIGLTQCSVSRLLRDLREAGWLVEVAKHQHGKRAKTYASGQVLRACFERALFAGRQYDLTAPYVDGASNEHFLRDVRVAVRLGIEVDHLIEIIQEKQSMRLAHKQRTAKDIARTYHLWLNRDRALEADQASA